MPTARARRASLRLEPRRDYDVLGPADGAFFAGVYDISPEGNWEDSNIPNRLDSWRCFGRGGGAAAWAAGKTFRGARGRVPPGRDDKVLADWNGLVIAALVNAAETFQEPRWLEAALAAYRFVKERMQRGDRLLHSYRAGKAHTPGVASDYANMIAAALRLHLATGDAAALGDAKAWAEVLDRHYRGEPGGYSCRRTIPATSSSA